MANAVQAVGTSKAEYSIWRVIMAFLCWHHDRVVRFLYFLGSSSRPFSVPSFILPQRHFRLYRLSRKPSQSAS